MRLTPFILIIMLAACGSTDEPPEEIYSQQQMAEILTEIHLLEEKLENLGMPYDSQKVMYPHFEALLFDKHQVDSARYRASFNYYMQDAEKMESIYETVVDSLVVREKTKKIN